MATDGNDKIVELVFFINNILIPTITSDPSWHGFLEARINNVLMRLSVRKKNDMRDELLKIWLPESACCHFSNLNRALSDLLRIRLSRDFCSTFSKKVEII
ncbi:MAG: hypothetical protein AAB632_00225 [Patescibacteria group bacterium]